MIFKKRAGRRRKKRKKLNAETASAAAAEVEGKVEEKVVRIRKNLRENKYLKSGDFPLFLIVMALVLFGVVMVFSASYYTAMSEENSAYYYLIRDSLWAIVGTVVMVALAVFDYHKLYKFAPLIMLIAFIMLGLIFTPLGVTINNATRWLDFKVFTIMPGELAKPACIIFVAAYLSADPRRARSFTKGVLPMMVLAGAVFALIFKQPNTSTAATAVIIIFGMMFIAGMNIAQLVGLCGAGVVGLLALILTKGDYRLDRITGFMNPLADSQGSGYQVTQSLYALGSGGLFGVGIGNSIQKTLYIPEPQNDFILAVIGEELGLVGLILLLLTYLFFLWRCVHIAMRAPDLFGTLLASGFSIMFAAHIIFNVLIVTAKMPPTGIILPFISWGGNALVIFMACVGIMLNISRQSEK